MAYYYSTKLTNNASFDFECDGAASFETSTAPSPALSSTSTIYNYKASSYLESLDVRSARRRHWDVPATFSRLPDLLLLEVEQNPLTFPPLLT